MKRSRLLAVSVIICVLSFFVSFSSVMAAVYEPITASIPVEGLKTKGFARRQVYNIAVEALDDAPVPEEDRLLVDEDDKGSFVITIDEPGTFIYKIYEVKGNDSNTVYDDTIYYVTVFVENTEELLKLRYGMSLTVNDLTTKPSEMEVSFINLPIKSEVPYHDDPPAPRPYIPDTPPSPVNTDKPVPEETTVVPDDTTRPDHPVEDHSAGAGIYGDGILIDVGTVLTNLTKANKTVQVSEFAEKIENSFIGSIPVIYLAGAAVIVILALAVFFRRREQDEKE